MPIVMLGKTIIVSDMGNILVLWAVGFFLAAILVGFFTENTWRNAGIAWAILSIGIILFAIALAL